MRVEVKPDCIDNDLVPKLLRLVLKDGFLCGSRRFGLWHDKSDWDYVVKSEVIESFVDIKALKKYNEGSHLPTLCMRINVYDDDEYSQFKSFNILVAISDHEFVAWHDSTDQFLHLMEIQLFKEIVKCKDARVAIFERLRELNGIPNKK